MLNSSSPTARKRLPLHIKVLLGFVLGGLLGLAAHFYAADAPLTQHVIAYVTKPLGQIFLNLLFMLVVPLMFSALVLGRRRTRRHREPGPARLEDLDVHRRGDRHGGRIGLVMVNLIKPGLHLDPALAQQVMADNAVKASDIVTSGHQLDAMQNAGEHRSAQRRRRRGRRQADARDRVLRADVRDRPGADAEQRRPRRSSTACRACSRSA